MQIWVAQVDEAAVRNTRDVDILLDRSDLDSAIEALGKSGFHYRKTAGVAMFLEGPNASPRDAVQVVFAGEKVKERYSEKAPSLLERERIKDVSTLSLEALVRMKAHELSAQGSSSPPRHDLGGPPRSIVGRAFLQ